MKHLAAAALAILATIGVGVAVHTVDTHRADRDIVTTYNDGFINGTCAGSTAVAAKYYHFTCPGNGS